MRNSEFWQAAGDSPEARADGFDGQMQKQDGSGRAERDQDGARDFPGVLQTVNHRGNRKDGHGGWSYRKRISRLSKSPHAVKEITGGVIHLQTAEVANLRAGDKDRDAVGEADDDEPRKVF